MPKTVTQTMTKKRDTKRYNLYEHSDGEQVVDALYVRKGTLDDAEKIKVSLTA